MRRTALASLLAAASLAAAPAAGAATAPTSAAATAPTRTATIAGGAKLGYRSIGSGRPIVLATGLGGAIDGWDPTFLDALAARGHRVVVFDNEGVGRSTARPGTLTIRRMGDDLAGLIDALHLGRPDVAGWSMGGMIAQSFAVRHPGRVRRLVLLATASGDGAYTAGGAQASGDLNSSTSDPAAGLALLFPAAQTAARDRYVRDLFLRKDPNPQATPEVFARQLAASGRWLAAQDPDGKRITRLRLPVLVGGGALDPLLPVANQRHLAKAIPHAELVTYADASHGFFLQHAKEFVPRLAQFLDAAPRRTA